MTQIRREGGGYCPAINTSGGADVKVDDSGYVSLTSGNTYVFDIGGTADGTLIGVHVQTDSAIAFNTSGMYIEVSNLPRTSNSSGSGRSDQTTDYSTTVGDWVKYDPSTAYVPATGTGWTVTNMTLTKTAGTGGAFFDIGNTAARRMRLTVVVTTTGKLRVNVSQKD
jgi:hypothetical protein